MAKTKITQIAYAIHNEDSSPIFGTDTIHISAEDGGAGIFYGIKNVNPSSTEFVGQNTLYLEDYELKAIVEVCKKLKEDIDD